MNGKEWAEGRMENIRRKYGEKAEEWKKEGDDRLIYCNMYNRMMEGLEWLKEDTPSFVVVAMTSKCFEYRAEMDEILERFKDK